MTAWGSRVCPVIYGHSGPTPRSGRPAASSVQPNHAETSAGSRPRLLRAAPRTWGLLLRNPANTVENRLVCAERGTPLRAKRPEASTPWVTTEIRNSAEERRLIFMGVPRMAHKDDKQQPTNGFIRPEELAEAHALCVHRQPPLRHAATVAS